MSILTSADPSSTPVIETASSLSSISAASDSTSDSISTSTEIINDTKDTVRLQGTLQTFHRVADNKTIPQLLFLNQHAITLQFPHNSTMLLASALEHARIIAERLNLSPSDTIILRHTTNSHHGIISLLAILISGATCVPLPFSSFVRGYDLDLAMSKCHPTGIISTVQGLLDCEYSCIRLKITEKCCAFDSVVSNCPEWAKDFTLQYDHLSGRQRDIKNSNPSINDVAFIIPPSTLQVTQRNVACLALSLCCESKETVFSSLDAISILKILLPVLLFGSGNVKISMKYLQNRISAPSKRRLGPSSNITAENNPAKNRDLLTLTGMYLESCKNILNFSSSLKCTLLMIHSDDKKSFLLTLPAQKGQEGIIVVSGPAVFSQYLHDVNSCTNNFIHDDFGILWFVTGDVGVVGEDGMSVFLRRRPSLLVRKKIALGGAKL